MTNHAVYPKLIILSYWNTPSGTAFLRHKAGDTEECGSVICKLLLFSVAYWVTNLL